MTEEKNKQQLSGTGGTRMRLKENKVYIKAGITAFLVIAAGILSYFLIDKLDQVSDAYRRVMAIVRPFIVGGALAYLLTPACNALDRVFLKWTRGRAEKTCKGISIAISLIVTIAIVTVLTAILVPQVIRSLVSVANALPGQINSARQQIDQWLADEPDLRRWWDRIFAQISGAITTWRETGLMPMVSSVLSGTASYVTGFAVAVKDILLGLIVTIYLLAARKRFAAQAGLTLKSLCPERWLPKVEEEVNFINHIFHGFLLGKLLDSAIIGVLCFLGCLAMGIPQAPLLGVVIGVTNVIPFVGPFIGAIPCALILLLSNPVHCLMFVIFILILQQLDGNVLGPRIIGSSTGISGFWITFAILFFGGLWGLVGMLVAVPLFAVIYDIVRKLLFRRLRRKGHGEMIAAYESTYHTAQAPVKKTRKAKTDKTDKTGKGDNPETEEETGETKETDQTPESGS